MNSLFCLQQGTILLKSESADQ